MFIRRLIAQWRIMLLKGEFAKAAVKRLNGAESDRGWARLTPSWDQIVARFWYYFPTFQ